MQNSAAPHLPVIEALPRPSVADQIFNELRGRIMSLELQPGARLSEVEVAGQMGVSRQPVRDAFYRLSKMGLLLIRPQRSTTVTLISEPAVMQARFVRAAIEMETVREAAGQLTHDDLEALGKLIEAQRVAMEADDKPTFHKLDDQFHKEICTRAGVGFTWDLVHEMKAHMDRVRVLSHSFASRTTWEDHVAILDSLKRNDGETAAAAMRLHLGRIREQIDRIKASNHDWFEGGAKE